jgi:hypothetical protein
MVFENSMNAGIGLYGVYKTKKSAQKYCDRLTERYPITNDPITNEGPFFVRECEVED